MGSGLKFPGLVERIAARMRAQGFEERGRLLWGRWAAAHGYQIALVGGWMKGGTPTYENCERLARDLGVSLPWLLLGERCAEAWDGVERRGTARDAAMARPIGGGSGLGEAQPVDFKLAIMLLIRHSLKHLGTLCVQLWPVAQLLGDGLAA